MAAPKSPQEMFKIMRGNFEEKTGKSFDYWVALAKESEIRKFKALTEHIMSEFQMTRGYAQLVAWGVLDPARLEAGNDNKEFVNDLYSDKKEHLRPIYEKLIDMGLDLGPDVNKVICKTYSSLRSRSQFAMIVPRNNSSVDLELVLPEETEITEPLEPFKSSNPKFKHRIRIKRVEEIDDFVLSKLKESLEHNRNP